MVVQAVTHNTNYLIYIFNLKYFAKVLNALSWNILILGIRRVWENRDFKMGIVKKNIYIYIYVVKALSLTW